MTQGQDADASTSRGSSPDAPTQALRTRDGKPRDGKPRDGKSRDDEPRTDTSRASSSRVGRDDKDRTTVLPGAAGKSAPRTGTARPVRPPVDRPAQGRAPARNRKARLALKRIDPWSVFIFSLVASIFLAIALVVAVAALYAVLDSLGVLTSINDLFREVSGETSSPLLTSSRIIGSAAILGAVNVVLLTLLATLGSLLYNLCASFTGGVEVTLGERDG